MQSTGIEQHEDSQIDLGILNVGYDSQYLIYHLYIVKFKRELKIGFAWREQGRSTGSILTAPAAIRNSENFAA